MRSFVKMTAWVLTLSMLLCLAPAPAAEQVLPELSDSGSLTMEKPTVDQLREQYASLTETKYTILEVPSIVSPYTLGKLSPTFITTGLDMLNLFRTIAGLPPAQTTDEENLSAQYGAVLLGATDELNHYPVQPEDMDDEFYQAGYEATSHSNICYISGTSSLNLAFQTSIRSYMEDFHPGNAERVGHRRWLLSPQLLNTGFGIARSATNRIYTTTKVTDKSGPKVDYNYIAWPASGNTPFGFFPIDVPWSVSLNPERYALPVRDELTITLTRLEDGASWTFDSSSPEASSTNTDPFFCVNTDLLGEGPAIIFRPELDRSMYLGEYEVTIRGLKDPSGGNADLRYRVNFFDIRPRVECDINNAQVHVVSGSWLLDPDTLYSIYRAEPITFDNLLVRDQDGQKLIEGVDYTITYRDNLNAGTGYLILTGIGNWYGVREFPFPILKAPVTLRLVYNPATVGYDVMVGNSIQTRIEALSPTDSTHFTYISEDPSIATVDENGRVTGCAPGEVKIWVHTEETANYESGSAWVHISVIDKEEPSYYFQYDPLYKCYGDKKFYNSLLRSGTSYPGTVFTYTSADPEIATVDDNGYVTITGVGETTITVFTSEDDGTKPGEFSYQLIVDKGQERVTARITDNTLDPGETTSIIASSKESPLSYASENPEIATVDENGIVTAVGPGTAVITVTAAETEHYYSAYAQVTVTVYEPDPVAIDPTHVIISPAHEFWLKEGETVQLTATVYPENATDKYCAWRSDQERYASVNASGLVTAREAGSATITVLTLNGKTDSAVVHVEHVHSPETIPGKGPTCTQTGLTEGSRCSACREVLVPQETIPALGHSFTNYISNGDATCISQGTKTALCDRCADSHTIPDDGGYGDHSFGEWSVIWEPSETEYGLEMRICLHCGKEDTRRIPATGQEPEPVNPFIDVSEGSFYYEPVLWALEEGITTGADATHFDPGGQCLRAQVVTFLWRAAGRPDPTGTVNPFVDVEKDSFYEKAVLWAVEKGITTGTDATHFSPNLACNRATVVTFLYRAFGEPAVENAANPFTDVPADDWYTAPVLWAVEQGITNGLTADSFGPTVPCNRAQIVTFLHRAYTD